MQKKQYRWTRFWLPQGDDAHFDDNGYFCDPEAGIGKYLNRNARTITALRDHPCLVLLGEGGTGKTHEIRILQAGAQPGASDDRSMFCDLGAYGSEDHLHADLFGSCVFQEWIGTRGQLTLFLDSLDEAFLEIKTVAEMIKRGLKRAPCERLAIRIVCRDVCWPDSLSDYLAELYGDEKFGTYRLAPLRRVDVIQAIQEEGLNSDEFLTAVQDAEAHALAINPSALGMLIAAYRHNRVLPRRKADLYEQGLKYLCEPSDARRERRHHPILSGTEMLEISAHVAALSLLSGRPTIYDGEECTAPPESTCLASLCHTHSEAAGQWQIAATEHGIRSTVESTGLFTRTGSNHYKFCHRTYQEYLAARFLARAKLSTQQLDSLLFLPGGTQRQLIPQLREVAAWLGSLDAHFLERVFELEPETVLLCDSSALDAGIKAPAIDVLLARIERADLPGEQIETLSKHYRKLRHSTLSEQVSKVLLDPGRNWRARATAIMIAVECGLRDTATTIASLALDQTQETRLRVRAAVAVARFQEEDACRMLRPLALGCAGDDPDDELRGCGLDATWPEYLTAKELFESLTPPKRSFFVGTYTVFLHRSRTVSELDETGLRIGMRWAASLSSSAASAGALDSIVVNLAREALNRLDDPSISGNLARMAINRSRVGLPLLDPDPHEDEDISMVRDGADAKMLIQETERRRMFLAAAVDAAVNLDEIRALTIAPRPFWLNEDFPWLLEQAHVTEGLTSEKWSLLASLAFDFHVPDHVSLWLAARSRSETVARAMPWAIYIDLSSEDACRQRADYEEMRQWEQRRSAARESKPPREERVKILARKCAECRADLFRILAAEIIPPEDASWHSGIPDLRSASLWSQLDAGTRYRVVEAARRYLEEARLDPGNQPSGGSSRLSDIAAAQAGLLLFSEDPRFLHDLDEQRWKALCGCILSAFDQIHPHDPEAARGLLALAWEKAPSEARTSAAQLVAKRASQSHLPLILYVLGTVADGEFLVTLLGELRQDPARWMGFGHILGWLLKERAPGGLEYAEGLVRPGAHTDSLDRRRSIQAACAMMLHAADAGWSVIWPALRNDPSWGRELLETLTDRADDLDVVVEERLTDEALGLLLGWLIREYPPETDEKPEGVYCPTPELELRDWRGRLISHLRDRGTRSSYSAIQMLCREFPEKEWLRNVLADAREKVRWSLWIPPTPSQILAMTQSTARRFIAGGSQLLDLICESLDRLERKLHGQTPAVGFLWDNANSKNPSPVVEEKLSDFVKLHLEYDLCRDVVVNREVEIRPALRFVPGAGQRSDILVTARQADQQGDTLIVIIESKGSWNDKVDDAMKTQLVERYMMETRSPFGLYMVGWFDCKAWPSEGRRRRRAPWASIEQARTELQAKARALSEALPHRGEVRAYVLDCRLM